MADAIPAFHRDRRMIPTGPKARHCCCTRNPSEPARRRTGRGGCVQPGYPQGRRSGHRESHPRGNPAAPGSSNALPRPMQPTEEPLRVEGWRAPDPGSLRALAQLPQPNRRGITITSTITPDRKVYAIRGARGHVKIGSTRDLGKRLATLQTGSPVKLRLVAVGPGDQQLERQLHEKFKARRVNGEWFALTESQITELAAFLGGSTSTTYLPKARRPRYGYRRR